MSRSQDEYEPQIWHRQLLSCESRKIFPLESKHCAKPWGELTYAHLSFLRFKKDKFHFDEGKQRLSSWLGAQRAYKRRWLEGLKEGWEGNHHFQERQQGWTLKEEKSSWIARKKMVKNTNQFHGFFQEEDLTINSVVANVTWCIGKK